MSRATQTDSRPPGVTRNRAHWLVAPFTLALIVTLANVVKPVVVDDTAYLTFARHIARCPLDPYGFEVFWYNVPEPAMGILCPPVLPYWLAIGIRLFGEHVALLKLWLFPFAWLLAWAISGLLQRFARGTETVALPLIVLSPAVLPMVNVMLDIPATALALASVLLFIRACERRDWRLTLASAALGALAMQTKYTALLVPPIILWYGITHAQLRCAIATIMAACVAFAAWEAIVYWQYGQSHFLFHLAAQQPAGDGGGRLREFLRDKFALAAPLAAHLGCLAFGIGLYAGRAIGLSRRVLIVAAVVWVIGVVLIAVLPHHLTVLVRGDAPHQKKLALAATLWRTSGAAVLVVALVCAWMLLVRRGRRIGLWRRADALFTVGWVLLEVAGYFALTPFPAARRAIGVTIALGILAARLVSRVNRARPERRHPQWIVAFGVTVGVLVAFLDTYDALPEKVLAERAAERIARQQHNGTVWYVGHWGFQFYCERAGMRPAIPGQTRLHAGDYLVLPVYPDDRGFWRPYPGNEIVHLPPESIEPIEVFVCDDWLSAQTIPNFYGGTEPIIGRDHPRLRVAVYRVSSNVLYRR